MSSPAQLKPVVTPERPQGEDPEPEPPNGEALQIRYGIYRQRQDRKWIDRYNLATFRGTRKCPRCLERRPKHAAEVCPGEEAKPKNHPGRKWYCKHKCGLYFPRALHKGQRLGHGNICPKNSDPRNTHYVIGFDKFEPDEDGYFTCPKCGEDGFQAHILAIHMNECNPTCDENPYSDGHQGFKCEKEGCGWFRTKVALTLHVENCGLNIGPVHLGMDHKLPNIYNMTYTQFATSMGWTVSGTKRVPRVTSLPREDIHACERVPENLLWRAPDAFEIIVAQLLASPTMDRDKKSELVRTYGCDLSRKLRTKLEVSQVSCLTQLTKTNRKQDHKPEVQPSTREEAWKQLYHHLHLELNKTRFDRFPDDLVHPRDGRPCPGIKWKHGLIQCPFNAVMNLSTCSCGLWFSREKDNLCNVLLGGNCALCGAITAKLVAWVGRSTYSPNGDLMCTIVGCGNPANPNPIRFEVRCDSHPTTLMQRVQLAVQSSAVPLPMTDEDDESEDDESDYFEGEDLEGGEDLEWEDSEGGEEGEEGEGWGFKGDDSSDAGRASGPAPAYIGSSSGKRKGSDAGLDQRKKKKMKKIKKKRDS